MFDNMGNLRRYRKLADQFVVAIQLNLDSAGFTYRKWGAEQWCNPGDWIVDNDGDIYSVNGEVFAKTYRKVGPGIYVKTTPIWAVLATQPGSVMTQEGESHYSSGDYLVSNSKDGRDCYCISSAKFESMYELDD